MVDTNEGSAVSAPSTATSSTSSPSNTANSRNADQGRALPAQQQRSMEGPGLRDETSGDLRTTDTITTRSEDRRKEAREEMMEVYRLFTPKQLYDRNESEERDIKTLIRTKLFREVKFVNNEGGSRFLKREREKLMINKIGLSHYRPDFTNLSSYAYHLAKMRGKFEGNTAVDYKSLAKWWIVYRGVVTSEIRQCRSTVNAKIRKSFFEGNYQSLHACGTLFVIPRVCSCFLPNLIFVFFRLCTKSDE